MTPWASSAECPQVLDRNLKVMRHGEDTPGDPKSRIIEFRVRRYMWNSAFSQWLRSPIIGIGFLPEVPSDIQPGAPNVGGYQAVGTPPVSGPHNSYLSILTRMGVIGFILFGWLMAALLRRAWALIGQHPQTIPDLLLIVIPLNGLIHAAVNVGLESPHHCMLLWLVAGMLVVWQPQVRRSGEVFSF